MSEVVINAPARAARPIPAADQHVARVIAFVDLGTQEDTFDGEKKIARKVRLSFELPNETAVFKEGAEPEAHIVHKEYTFSMNKKSTLRKLVDNVFGAFPNEAEAQKFNLAKLVGAPVAVTIEHKPDTQGEIRARITNVCKLPRAFGECPPQVYASVLYVTSFGANEVFQKLPEWVREKIQESPEFAQAAGA